MSEFKLERAQKELQEYQQSLDKITKKAEDASRLITNKSGKIYEFISDLAINTEEDITTRVIKAAAYRTEYEELMSKKRQRTLGTEENKWAQVLRANIEYYETLRDKDFENLKFNLEMGTIKNEEYYENLRKLRDLYFDEGSSEWNKYTLEIVKYNQGVLDSQKELLEGIFNDVGKEYEEKFDELIKKQKDVSKKLTNVEIYDKITVGSGDKKFSWIQLSAIDKELDLVKRYNSALLGAKDRINEVFDTLSITDEEKKKYKSDFFAQLLEMDINDAAGFSGYLTNIDKSVLTDYIKKWTEKMQLSDEVAKGFFSEESQQLMSDYGIDMANTFKEGISESLADVPDEFFKTGTDACQQFKNGFLSSVDSVMDEINKKVLSKASYIFGDFSTPETVSSSVTNNSSYNIYGAINPEQTALEIFKEETKKRMLVGK